MNQDTAQGEWKQFKGQVRERWGKLTDDHLDVIAGKRDQLIGRVQELYGLARDVAEREVDEFQRGHKKGFRLELASASTCPDPAGHLIRKRF